MLQKILIASLPYIIIVPKLFVDLYLVKFLDVSAKPRENKHNNKSVYEKNGFTKKSKILTGFRLEK